MARSRIPSSNSPKSEAAPVASRRRYSPEVRRKAVELVLSGKSKVRVAREIGCSAETIRLWVKKAKEKLSEEAGTGAPSEERSESGKVPRKNLNPDKTVACGNFLVSTYRFFVRASSWRVTIGT